MDILIEVTVDGVTQRLHIDDAPAGTELVVLEQFLAGPGATLQMIKEAADEPEEPESTLRDVQGTIERTKLDLYRQTANTIGKRSDYHGERQAAAAARRIEESKRIRSLANLNAAAVDCLNLLTQGDARRHN